MLHNLQQALALHQAGDLRAATALYSSHLKASPKDTGTLYLFGVHLLQSERF